MAHIKPAFAIVTDETERGRLPIFRYYLELFDDLMIHRRMDLPPDAMSRATEPAPHITPATTSAQESDSGAANGIAARENTIAPATTGPSFR